MTAKCEQFETNKWTIISTKSHILGSGCSSRNDVPSPSCCDFCHFSIELKLHHLPEMVFPNNILEIKYEHHSGVRFCALDALRYVDPCKAPVKIACSKEWKESRRDTGLVDKYINQFDWTYSTYYEGTLFGYRSIETTEERINMEKLKEKEEILFYSDLTLFEDELHDNGIAVCSVKIRCMPSGFFALLRYFLRVDGVMMRIHDTRFYKAIECDYILREVCRRELYTTEIPVGKSGTLTDPGTFANSLPIVYERHEKIKFDKTS